MLSMEYLCYYTAAVIDFFTLSSGSTYCSTCDSIEWHFVPTLPECQLKYVKRDFCSNFKNLDTLRLTCVLAGLRIDGKTETHYY
jgi:hypothetical protein